MDPLASNWLTIEQAAEDLQVPARMYRSWVKLGAVKHFKTGDIIRIHRQDHQAFCESLSLEPWARTRIKKPAQIMKPNFGIVAAQAS
jgi:excisionase family DNA binding protein